MADRTYDVSILLGVVDKYSSQLQQFDRSLLNSIATMKTMAVGGLSIAGVTASLYKLISAGADEELAMKRLEQSVENAGVSFDKNSARINQFVASMTNTTILADDRVVPALQQMMTYTNNMDEAFRAVKIAADMGASGFMDFDSAVRYVGLALSGNVSMLGRYIPELKETNLEIAGITGTSEKAEYALQLLSDRFGGMATIEADNFNGQVQMMKNHLGDLAEKIGRELTPSLQMYNDILKNINEYTERNTASKISQVAVDEDSINVIKREIGILDGLIAKEKQYSQEWMDLQGERADQKNKLALLEKKLSADTARDAQKNDNDTTEQLKFNANSLMQYYISNASQLISVQNALNAQMLANDRVSIQDRIMEYSKLSTAEIEQKYMTVEEGKAANEKVWENWQTLTSNTFNLLNNWYTWQSSKLKSEKDEELDALETWYNSEKNRISTTVEDHEEMTRLLAQLDVDYADKQEAINDDYETEAKALLEKKKAWSKAEATINGATAIIKGYAEMGPILGSLNAALQAGITATQIAVIDSQTFAKGVRGFAGGMALVGEQGPELVSLPAGSSVYTNSESARMMSGGTSIVVSGNQFYGTGGIDQFCDMVEERLLSKVQNERYL